MRFLLIFVPLDQRLFSFWDTARDLQGVCRDDEDSDDCDGEDKSRGSAGRNNNGGGEEEDVVFNYGVDGDDRQAVGGNIRLKYSGDEGRDGGCVGCGGDNSLSGMGSRSHGAVE